MGHASCFVDASSYRSHVCTDGTNLSTFEPIATAARLHHCTGRSPRARCSTVSLARGATASSTSRTVAACWTGKSSPAPSTSTTCAICVASKHTADCAHQRTLLKTRVKTQQARCSPHERCRKMRGTGLTHVNTEQKTGCRPSTVVWSSSALRTCSSSLSRLVLGFLMRLCGRHLIVGRHPSHNGGNHRGLERRQAGVIGGALHVAAARDPPIRCHEGNTRSAVRVGTVALRPRQRGSVRVRCISEE